MRVSGLYAGIGGFELGLARAGHDTLLLCECNERAQTVLRRRFPNVGLVGDVDQLDRLPKGTEIVAAGFPCQNLSMAGDKSGLSGPKSRVVERLFDLLERDRAPWVVIENVYFMLHLAKGAAMEHILSRLEALGYRWAYRVVDSRAFGLAQRRRRVFIVASNAGDPRDVLLADDAPDPQWPAIDLGRPTAFYWTEGRTGHGLTADAIPPLKAGSGIGIPSPPAVLLPTGRVVTPTIEVIERLQGFPARWTWNKSRNAHRYRWHLVGNAVSVPVAEWLGRCLEKPGLYDASSDTPLDPHDRWPKAAWYMGSDRHAASISEYPIRKSPGRLSAFATHTWPDLSTRALTGFVRRAREGRLRYPEGFLAVLERNLASRNAPVCDCVSARSQQDFGDLT